MFRKNKHRLEKVRKRKLTLGNIHVLRKQVLGVFVPHPPLSWKVSIWHDPPLLLRKVFMCENLENENSVETSFQSDKQD